MKPGKPEKYDYEYKRNGKANIFITVDPKQVKGMFKSQTTEQRKISQDI